MTGRIAAFAVAMLLAGGTVECFAEPEPTSSDARYEEITHCLRSLELRTDLKKPFAPNEEKLAAITESLRTADAEQIEEQGFLVLTYVVLEDEDLETIARLRSMRGLALHRCTVSAQGFATAAKAWGDSLERLSLDMVTIEDDEGVAANAMERFGKLRYLRLSNCNVPPGVVEAASKLPIEVLDVNRIGKIDKVAFTRLLGSGFESLKALDVHHWKKREDRDAVQSARPDVRTGAIGKKYRVDQPLPE